MSDRPTFSVVIPTYGRSEYLREAVDSVLAQTFDDFECLVVSDGGESPPALPDDARLRVLRRDVNGGAAAARNTGIEAAEGAYVAFLDDDDRYTPDRLASHVPRLGDAPVLTSWVADLDDQSRPLSHGRRVLDGRVDVEILEAPPPHLGTCSVERGAVLRFDESYRVSEDVEWWLRTSLAHPVATVPHVGYLLRDHSGERLTRALEKRVETRERLLHQHESYFAARPAAAAYHWKRLGGMALSAGQYRVARRAFTRSLTRRPSAGAIVGVAAAVVHTDPERVVRRARRRIRAARA